MKKTDLQRHYEYLNSEFNFFKRFTDYDSQKIIQTRIGTYILNDPELLKYIVALSGSGNPDFYLAEITSEIIWFERDMPGILNALMIDINK